MTHVLLVDAGAFVHRYVRGGKIPLESPGPSVLRRLMEDLQTFGARWPDARAVLCFDGGRGWRGQVYAAYKGQRPQDEMRGAAIVALHYVQRRLEDLGVAYVRVADVEADDLLSLLAATCRTSRVPAVIVSDDHDLYQCLGPEVAICHPSTGQILTHEQALAPWYGSAVLFRVWKALAGDRSDNLKGMRGIGEEHAFELIAYLQQSGRFAADLFGPETQRLYGDKGWFKKSMLTPGAIDELTTWFRLASTAETVEELCPAELANDGGWWLVPGLAAAELSGALQRLASPTAPQAEAWSRLCRDADLWQIDEAVCLRVLGLIAPSVFQGAPSFAARAHVSAAV